VKAAHDQLELEYTPDTKIPDRPISTISDVQLAEHVCRVRTVFSFTSDGIREQAVECLVLSSGLHRSLGLQPSTVHCSTCSVVVRPGLSAGQSDLNPLGGVQQTSVVGGTECSL
jgi:hypothetical protein